MDTYKIHVEKSQWGQHKNAMSYFEQILEATPMKQQLYGHLPPISITIQDKQDMQDTAREAKMNS